MACRYLTFVEFSHLVMRPSFHQCVLCMIYFIINFLFGFYSHLQVLDRCQQTFFCTGIHSKYKYFAGSITCLATTQLHICMKALMYLKINSYVSEKFYRYLKYFFIILYIAKYYFDLFLTCWLYKNMQQTKL